ncbi:hypothetical protein M436DRAFT_79648 [Aureobasidium namibiae CBS 147.97]|uniref:Uncharacterized protein n=1 Tax=Aureobasidium namibiae CBS 147.97 TaxID=1043004 RepID=A0A074WPZ3_9PEZI
MFSFSYSVTRQYPYKWFTPVAIVGGIILAVMFSAINFWSNAYTMVTATTSQLSVVEDPDTWLGHAPRIFTSKILPTCDQTSFLIGSMVYTNQTAFASQLLSAGGALELFYGGWQIHSCKDLQVSIEFETNSGRQAAQMDTSGWGATVGANIDCVLDNKVSSEMTLSAGYDPLSWGMDQGGPVVMGLSSFHSDFRWAETLLLSFWTETITAITSQTATQSEDQDLSSSRYNLTSGYISFRSPGPDITDASFFSKGQYAFFDSNLQGQKGYFDSSEGLSYGNLVGNASWPDIWAPADRLAKAMFSTITADLGQTYRTPSDMSMIMTADQIQYWTENLTHIWNASTVLDKDKLEDDRWFQMTQYNATRDEPVEPFTNSTLAAAYVCQVPVLKSHFNIFISILVADVVLLRVAWTLYNYIVCYFLKDRQPDSNLCPGCLERGQSDEAGTEELENVDVGEDTGYHGRDIEMGDLGRDREEQADQQSLQKLLTRKPVGS